MDVNKYLPVVGIRINIIIASNAGSTDEPAADSESEELPAVHMVR